MIYIKEMDKSCFEIYDSISMNVDVRSIYKINRIDNGLGGFNFEEIEVVPYKKDLGVYERATEYEATFDIKNWRFYIGRSCSALITILRSILSARPSFCSSAMSREFSSCFN